jgi:hypothetical protein
MLLEPPQLKFKLKLFLSLTKHHSMKTYGRVQIYLHAFLTSQQVVVSV